MMHWATDILAYFRITKEQAAAKEGYGKTEAHTCTDQGDQI